MKGKKYLIIGIYGFIGKHLSNYLLKQECEVFGADIVSLDNHKNFFLIDSQKSNYNELFSSQKFDYCINCSGAASVPQSIINPFLDFELNSINVFKICESIRNHNADCKFINLSSAAVYGNPVKLPISEIDEVHPISPYGIHKNISEEICREFHDNFSLQTCSLRVFSAFGEGLKKQFFWDLYSHMSKESDIVLFGTGLETRDFIYIQDLIKAIYIISQKSDFKADVINVGNGVEVKIAEAANIFKQAYGFKNEVKFSGEVRIGDPINWCADISKLISLGYKSVFTLQEGIENYITWVRTTQK